MKRQGPVVLCILDGWGLNPVRAGNAVAAALVHAAITSALGPAFAAAGAAPPGLGSAGLVAASLVASAAWWVWLPGRPIAPGAAATRSGRLRG